MGNFLKSPDPFHFFMLAMRISARGIDILFIYSSTGVQQLLKRRPVVNANAFSVFFIFFRQCVKRTIVCFDIFVYPSSIVGPILAVDNIFKEARRFSAVLM
jgi:hypothetical protein